MSSGDSPAICVVNPYSGIWAHTFQMADISVQFEKLGYEIEVIDCQGALKSHCTVMEAKRLPLAASRMDKARVCGACVEKNNRLRGIFSQNFLKVGFRSIDGLVSVSKVETLYRRALETIGENAGDCEGPSLEQSIVRLAAYETALKYKLTSLSTAGEVGKHLRIGVRNAAMAYLAGVELFGQERYSAVIIYSPQYGVHGALALAAKHSGLRVLFVEGSSSIRERYSSVRIWDWEVWKLNNPALAFWPGAELLKLTRKNRRALVRERSLRNRASDFSTYSTRHNKDFNLRNALGISVSSHILLLTLSSSDEVFAAELIGGLDAGRTSQSVFSSQKEWVLATLNHLSSFSEISVVVRLHPRDFPNKRDNLRSPASFLWEETLSSSPDNVFVDHPNLKIPVSSYWTEAIGVVSGWSSTLLEAMLAGVPALSYDQKLLPVPPDVILGGRSREDYFTLLNKLLAKDLYKQPVRESAEKWAHFSQFRGTIRAGEPIGFGNELRGKIERLFQRRGIARTALHHFSSRGIPDPRLEALVSGRSSVF